jgi:hypothetical protein
MPRELFVRTFFKNKEAGISRGYTYHTDCYIKNYTEKFNYNVMYYMKTLPPPKKMGPKPLSSDPVKYRKLRALYRYHIKMGNMDRARDVRYEIERLLPSYILIESIIPVIKEIVNGDTNTSESSNSLVIRSGIPESSDTIEDATVRVDEAAGEVWPETIS